MKILIVTGGNIDCDFAFSFLEKNTYDEIIGVDGGLAFVEKAGLKLTHLVGDFDTIDPEILQHYIHREDLSVHQFVPEKDYTDTDIAVKLAVELFAEIQSGDEKKLHILGGTGSRLDHVLANLQMLKRPMEAGIEAMIVDSNNQIQLIQGRATVRKANTIGKYISLIPATQRLEGITLKGFKYPLTDAHTAFGESLCVSNELTGDAGEILINKGMAWLICSRD